MKAVGAGQLVGYARTSTVDQVAGLEAQVAELEAAGCSKVFKEHGSGVDAARPELARALEYVRAGDTFIATKPDRIGRSTADLLKTVNALREKGVAVHIRSMGLDTTTATGKMLLTMLASIAEFERDLMLERQRAGIDKAKADGKYKGRSPTARAKSAEVMAMHHDGKTPGDIVKALGIGRASVYRIIDAAKAGALAP